MIGGEVERAGEEVLIVASLASCNVRKQHPDEKPQKKEGEPPPSPPSASASTVKPLGGVLGRQVHHAHGVLGRAGVERGAQFIVTLVVNIVLKTPARTCARTCTQRACATWLDQNAADSTQTATVNTLCRTIPMRRRWGCGARRACLRSSAPRPPRAPPPRRAAAPRARALVRGRQQLTSVTADFPKFQEPPPQMPTSMAKPLPHFCGTHACMRSWRRRVGGNGRSDARGVARLPPPRARAPPPHAARNSAGALVRGRNDSVFHQSSRASWRGNVAKHHQPWQAGMHACMHASDQW